MCPSRRETFEPEDLARLGSMFDEAWAAVAARFAKADEAERAAARARLAGIMMELLNQQLVADGLPQRAIAIFQFADPRAAPANGVGDATRSD